MPMTADEALRRWNILEKIGMGIHAIPTGISKRGAGRIAAETAGRLAFGPIGSLLPAAAEAVNQQIPPYIKDYAVQTGLKGMVKSLRPEAWADAYGPAIRATERTGIGLWGGKEGLAQADRAAAAARIPQSPQQRMGEFRMLAGGPDELAPGEVRIGGGPIEKAGAAIARLEGQRAQIPGYTGDDMAMALNRRYLEATRANAVRYGLQPGLTDEEKLASLTAKWNRTHDTAKRQAILQEAGPIQANIDQKNALARGEQQTQQLATKLGIPLEEARIQAGARGASDMTRLAGDVITEAGRNRATQLSALDRAMLSPGERQARKNEIEGDYQAMVKGLQRFGIGGQEEGRPEQTTAQGNSADLNNDGRVSPEEQQYNFAVTQLKNNKLLTPAERARLEAKRKELEPKILGVPAANA